MSAATEIKSRLDVGRERWDAFVNETDEGWLWHRWDLIEALAFWPGYEDASFALVDRQGTLLALMPLHRVVTRVARVMPIVRLVSLGGPASARSSKRELILSELHDHLLQLIADHNAVAAETQIAALTPLLRGPGAPKDNPLVGAGFENKQTETWMVDLTRRPDEIRRRYSELTRRELRKASQSEIRLREAAGSKDLEIYYRLHLETYARTGATPHPLAYFQAIFEKFQPVGLARILFAERRRTRDATRRAQSIGPARQSLTRRAAKTGCCLTRRLFRRATKASRTTKPDKLSSIRPIPKSAALAASNNLLARICGLIIAARFIRGA